MFYHIENSLIRLYLPSRKASDDEYHTIVIHNFFVPDLTGRPFDLGSQPRPLQTENNTAASRINVNDKMRLIITNIIHEIKIGSKGLKKKISST